jgi:hypothetical protein
MKRWVPLLALLTVGWVWMLPACQTGGAKKDSGGEDGDVPFEGLVLNVSGTASVLPVAKAWMTDAGLALPSLNGLTLRIEEPLMVALDDPDGIFNSTTLDAGGSFSLGGVAVDRVSLGVAAGILDGTDAGRITRAATVLYDVAIKGEKPSTNLDDVKAYALPGPFHDQLTAAVGSAAISTRTAGQQSTLIGAGFILGQVVNNAGVPQEGVKILPSLSSHAAGFFYPTADFTGTQSTGTSANGLFVYLHTGGEVETFRYTVEGRPDYVERNAGAVKNAAVLVTVYPGRTPPP